MYRLPLNSDNSEVTDISQPLYAARSQQVCFLSSNTFPSGVWFLLKSIVMTRCVSMCSMYWVSNLNDLIFW